MAKVTDDFLLARTVEEMQEFVSALGTRFLVGKAVRDHKLYFDGCEIEQLETGSIRMPMVRYLERLNPVYLSRTRRKECNGRATAVELKQYRSLACTLMYLGNGVLPQAAYITSLMQQ